MVRGVVTRGSDARPTTKHKAWHLCECGLRGQLRVSLTRSLQATIGISCFCLQLGDSLSSTRQVALYIHGVCSVSLRWRATPTTGGANHVR